MTDQIVRADERRRTETPNAVMTTWASPSQGRTQALSLWHVDMKEGVAGPVHTFDSEQVWSFLDGRARVTVDGVTTDLGPGDTVVFPAGTVRQVTALTALRIVVCGSGAGIASVPGETTDRGTPPWIS